MAIMKIMSEGFDPKKITVKRGDTVTFVNSTDTEQTVNIDADSLFGCDSFSVAANSSTVKNVQQSANTMTYKVIDVPAANDKGMLTDPPGETGEIEVKD